jgi:hypothetical protein
MRSTHCRIYELIRAIVTPSELSTTPEKRALDRIPIDR